MQLNAPQKILYLYVPSVQQDLLMFLLIQNLYAGKNTCTRFQPAEKLQEEDTFGQMIKLKSSCGRSF